MRTWRHWYLIFLLTHCSTDTTRSTPGAKEAPTGDTFVLY